MKIEIDLNNILFDENYGPESLQESVHRQIVHNLQTQLTGTVAAKVRQEIDAQIADTVAEEIKKRLPALFEDLMDAEYVPVSGYGSKGSPTSFRKELVKTIQEQMVYKKTHSSYDANAFTKAVDSIVEEQVKAIRADFNKQVQTDVAKQAFDEAVKLLRQKIVGV